MMYTIKKFKDGQVTAEINRANALKMSFLTINK
jgi:hypothetical protein